MSKGECVTSGLTISGMGIAMILMGFHPLWAGSIATLGAAIALIAIFRPDPRISKTRKRLLRVAQAAIDVAASAPTDEEFCRSFYEWRPEITALRDFIRHQYGLRERDFQMEQELISRNEAEGFAASLRELAGRIE